MRVAPSCCLAGRWELLTHRLKTHISPSAAFLRRIHQPGAASVVGSSLWLFISAGLFCVIRLGKNSDMFYVFCKKKISAWKCLPRFTIKRCVYMFPYGVNENMKCPVIGDQGFLLLTANLVFIKCNKQPSSCEGVYSYTSSHVNHNVCIVSMTVQTHCCQETVLVCT